MWRTILAVAVVCGAAWAQAPDASPTFEVASIKAAAPQQMGRMMVGMRGGPGTRDPGQVAFSNANLKMLLTQAYNIKDFQVSGPAALDTERFDIVAKVPRDATKEQFRVMLQNLLAERFKLALHKETREAAVYALLVAKGGVKMKESAPDAPADPNAPKAADAQPPPPPPGGPGGGGIGPPPMGRDGFPAPPGGAARGSMMIMMGPKGLRMQAKGITMARLTDMLGMQTGRPVVDMTKLTAEYDITMDFSAEGLQMMRGMPPMGPPPGAPGPETGHDSEASPTIFTAVQEQLGLRLESRKAPVDYFIVDHVEKAPTEN
jgi:uncharacterized protein (TIGR03435 family)